MHSAPHETFHILEIGLEIMGGGHEGGSPTFDPELVRVYAFMWVGGGLDKEP